MSIESIRWVMNAPATPLTVTKFQATPAPGEVTVEIAGCGVCHTDLGYYYDGVRTNHPLPLCLGHEISGHVVAAGPGAESWMGRAVIVPAVIPCGTCDACKRGKGTICPHQKMPGNDIQGGFARHIVVPQTGLCPVDEARLEAAGLTLADVSVVADAVTTPYQAVLQADVKPGDLVVVNGIGGVGGYCAQMAKAFGGTVVAIDLSQEKLDAIGSTPPPSPSMRAASNCAISRARSTASPRSAGCARPSGPFSNAPAPAPARRPRSACSTAAPRWASSASPWTRSSCGSPT
jgi:6-hydroxycyclohex-1-ene-1-carbonyl-CoA dehydrogenase